jgi:AmmeMemoRadiSam system protein B
MTEMILGMLILVAASGDKPHLRQPVDSIGYAVRPDQVEAVVAVSDSMIRAGYAADAEGHLPGGAMIGAILPHDDYIFAGPYYQAALRELRAPLVVMFGVAHRARRVGLEGKLIFDTFDGWMGPYGPMEVSSLRDRLIEALPAGMVMVSDDFHDAEHSLEALIPFVQYHGRKRGDDVEILPVLVTRMAGGLFEVAADTLASVLSGVLSDEGLKLGDDVCILVSADCVHYGDEGWSGRNYAPFGIGGESYRKAVAQDIDIIRSSLTGTVTPDRIDLFREKVDSGGLEWPYKVTWCGVYSIPFGLGVLEKLAVLSGRDRPAGIMFGYGTSLDPGRLPLEGTGLGATNINTPGHWVGYVSIGYW